MSSVHHISHIYQKSPIFCRQRVLHLTIVYVMWVWIHWCCLLLLIARPFVHHISRIYQKSPIFCQHYRRIFDNHIRYPGLNTLGVLAGADLKAISTWNITCQSTEPYILSTIESYMTTTYVISVWIHWGCLRVLIARPSVRHISHIYQKSLFILSIKRPIFDNHICYLGLNTLGLLASADRKAISTSYITHLSKLTYILSTKEPYIWQ